MITILEQLKDNYAYILRYGNKKALVIDPAESDSVLRDLEKDQSSLTHILNTHHHSDHVSGNLELQKQTGCWIMGPNDKRIPGLEQAVKGGDTILIGPLTFTVFDAPGHTKTHVIFHLPSESSLFTGDLLFGGGAGKLFEGTAEEMVDSLKQLEQFPGKTKIYPGHEYTVKNLEFAARIEPQNQDIQNRLKECRRLREQKKPTVPSTLEVERKTNPFLRACEPQVKENLQMKNETEIHVFSKIRKLKDSF